jgi:tryptophan synthase beta subunit
LVQYWSQLNATNISHFYKRLDQYYDDLYAKDKEAYSMGLKDLIRGFTGKPNSLNHSRRSYEKSKCPVCGQVCYNREDLQLHLKYNHPDVASAKPV